jgi:hypothetical protein
VLGAALAGMVSAPLTAAHAAEQTFPMRVLRAYLQPATADSVAILG